ncbi:MAG: glutathione S-transferase [endosymbiont of Galathealinum brachiosum]|uniref:Glutathione S-transferase n=1 Tax=endosymbiont of Galathealinum brachiosum TaxID=2200906 RepID=A0A370DIJ4_9GAMM|nr:MAG: glutathione S-transferase [endosymbiont of Galathealinum brachiosum]
MTLPILYSLQNCPYAMRARLGILLAQQTVRLRAIVMQDKPPEMLALSPKGTVPVLVLEAKSNKTVIDESLDIMLWALKLNDPGNLLYSQDTDALVEMLKIIKDNDENFKPKLEQYKRAKRFHGDDEEQCRLLCEPFIQSLEIRLTQHEFLMGSTPSLLDYALLPFVRQFSRVNRQLYLQGPYTHLQRWLNQHLQSRLFSKAMFKYPLWLDNHEECLFGK